MHKVSPERPQSELAERSEAGTAREWSWLDDLPTRFDTAAASAGDASEQHYLVAGHPLRLRFAGSGSPLLRGFAPALAHLRSDESGGEGHAVFVWDGASTGTGPPPVEVPAGSPPGTVFTHFRARRSVLYMVGLRSLSASDPDADASWYWTADGSLLPSWERAAPIRHILHWWLATKGIHQLHAGAVGTERGGVLLAGGPGRGKSTSTLAALGAGLAYVGDDYVAVECEPSPVVHSLFCVGKIEPKDLERFPHLRGRTEIDDIMVPGDFEKPKAILDVHTHFPAQTVRSLPLCAILLPTVDAGGTTALLPARRGEALRALAPSTLLQLHVGDPTLFTKMTDLVQRLPAYTLRLGRDVEQVGPLIAQLVEELSPADG